MIVHLTTKPDWQKALNEGEYRIDSLEKEGFIHCSTDAQILEVANRFYRDVPELVLVWIDPGWLQADLRWEPPVHPSSAQSGQVPKEDAVLFPHVYGPINLDAVVGIVDFLSHADGIFREVPRIGG